MTTSTEPRSARAAAASAGAERGLLVVGDPGRAALEVADGAPPSTIGHADVEASSAAVDGVVIRAATVRGILHRRFDGPRQDAFALAARCTAGEPDAAVGVVCDGVGSAAQSHLAAQAASRGLAQLAADGVGWPEAFAQVNDVIAALAGATEGPDGRGAMATTAVAADLRRGGGGWLVDLAWVGDSSCWHLDPSGTWTPLAGVPDDDGAFHSTAVDPLPSPDGACRTARVELTAGAVFLFSDDVANALLWSETVALTLAGWWAQAPDALTFARQVGFARRGHMDDRTAVGFWLPGGGEEAGHDGA